MAHLLRKHRVAVLIVVEVAYWLLTRMIVRQYSDQPVAGEWLRTGLRLVTFALDAWLFWPLISSQRVSVEALRRPSLVLGLAIFLTVALLTVNPLPYSKSVLALYAFTSIPVALKEELLFRAIMQRGVQDKLGTPGAVLFASLIFTAWHFGLAHGSWDYVQIFVASCLLGLVYAYSGSLAVVVAVHAVYDALWCAPLSLPRPLSASSGMALLLLALAVIAAWAWGRAGFACPAFVHTWRFPRADDNTRS